MARHPHSSKRTAVISHSQGVDFLGRSDTQIEETQMTLLRRFLHRRKPVANVTVCISRCGETTYDACLWSVLKQKTEPRILTTISNVHPMPAMMDESLARAETPWLMRVCADMILDPHCLATLWRHAQGRENEVAIVGANLRDRVYGIIGTVGLLNAGALKKFGYHYPRNDPRPDRHAIEFLVGLGYKVVTLDCVLGEHNPYATAYETFRRFYGTFQKRPRHHSPHEHVQRIIAYWIKTRDNDGTWLMLAGLVSGAGRPNGEDRDYVDCEHMDRAFCDAVNRLPDSTRLSPGVKPETKGTSS